MVPARALRGLDLRRQLQQELGGCREIEACSSDQYPRPAPRPANSQLEKRVLRLAQRNPMPHWQDDLKQFVKEYPNG